MTPVAYAPGTDAALHAIADAVAAWLPAGFALAAAHASTEWAIPLADSLLVANAVASRQRDFIGGRWCAHRALAMVGSPVDALPAGVRGAPAWPAGTLGSITHDAGWCIAVAGHHHEMTGLGIDLCAADRAPALQPLGDLVLHPAERAQGLASRLPSAFCIKEAVVKAVSAGVDRYLDLQDIVIEWSADSFEAKVMGHGTRIHGRHAMTSAGVFALAICPSTA
ncbi:MAG TPA: 4'-phosphopantetheinyl transferase superfamily protein [Ideonella sp.]|uniref:4'-phosphopantetheinyl transferase family protein n=1 Tax=Ideonella sp. TaxID=1929293 RepID=UPI002E2F8EF0|nr:4'-phosphopantetheinyl transferase superfamily protein [Ideonella sp.]HEX5686539.1 4'-phosphopantetheinyl transferase superfamily protein [Ideonella sp.]